jgi:hypothetical protein
VHTTSAASSLALLLVLFAGCVSQPNAEPPPSTSDVAPPAAFDDSTGAVSGIVTNIELQPIAGAQIGLQGTAFQSRTSRDGSFSFSLVPPGEYTLLAGGVGYSSVARKVLIEAGAETARIQVALAAIAFSEARAETFVFEGYIACTIGAFGFLSEECGEGLQTDIGTFGRNPNNKIDWHWNITENQTDLKGTLIELVWIPGSAAASQLTLYVANKFSCTPSCEADGPEYCDTDNHGPPVQRCYIDNLRIRDGDYPWHMTARAWGAPVPANEPPNVVVEQKFTMYRTDFYGVMGARDFTAVPDT